MKKARSSRRINKIGTTTDTITGRGGLALFSRYLEMIGIFDIISLKFGFIRKSSKGLPVWILFKQIFCFFFDGTSRHLTYFDQLKKVNGAKSLSRAIFRTSRVFMVDAFSHFRSMAARSSWVIRAIPCLSTRASSVSPNVIQNNMAYRLSYIK